MSRWVTVALGLAASSFGCTRTNPDFGDQRGMGTGDATSAGSNTAATTSSTTEATAISNTTSSTGMADTGVVSGSSGTTGGIGDWKKCPELVYGLTVQNPQLLLVSLDTGASVPLIDDVGGAAVATDPNAGDVYGWPFEALAPGFVAYVGDPFSVETLDALAGPNVLGAGFGSAGTVWMLTDSDGTSVSEYVLGSPLVEPRVDVENATEGDLVVVDDLAVVFSDALWVTVVDIVADDPVPPVQISGIDGSHIVTGAAMVEGAFWISTRETNISGVAQLWRLNYANDLTQIEWAEGPITVDAQLTDLAPVFAHDKACARLFDLFG